MTKRNKGEKQVRISVLLPDWMVEMLDWKGMGNRSYTIRQLLRERLEHEEYKFFEQKKQKKGFNRFFEKKIR
ncbi:MAG TPA: hypothetical protein ACFYD6_10155 [Candidatus Brocadiia bacterium]|nr:hypothetical protein [Planctomycetota bacterium]MDO8093548.1 hypothetical protein [Candidatus Brocadiales bacterium]